MSCVHLFPGQGSFTETILAEIVKSNPQFKREYEISCSIVRKYFGIDLANYLYEPQDGVRKVEDSFEISQVVIYLSSYFLNQILVAQGQRPEIYAGHSVGEITALACGGALSFEDGLRVVCMRAEAVIHSGKQGSMYAVMASPSRVKSLIDFMGASDVHVGVVNSEGQTIVSGSNEALVSFLQMLDLAKVTSAKLKSLYPFHSPLMLAAVPKFYEDLKAIKQNSHFEKIYSPMLGRFYRPEDNLAEVLSLHLVQPLYFDRAVHQLVKAGATQFIECSGRKALSNIVNSILKPAGSVEVSNFAGASNAGAKITPPSSSTSAVSEKVVSPVDPIVKAEKISDANVQSEVIAIFQRLTSYPAEVLDINAHLESELGLDSVKQLEIMTEVFDHFKLPVPEKVEIGKFNTILRISDYLLSQLSQGATFSSVEQTVVKLAEVQASEMTSSVKISAGLSQAEVTARVLAIFKELTSYPEEVLELDAQIESELGLDSVKQLEIMSALYSSFGLATPEKFEIAQYNSIRKVVDLIYSLSGTSSSPIVHVEKKVIPLKAPVQAQTSVKVESIIPQVLQVFQNLTSYPVEVLELDAQLESELGLDSVKQLEVFGALMTEFSITSDSKVEIAKYNTIRKVADFVAGELNSSASVGKVYDKASA